MLPTASSFTQSITHNIPEAEFPVVRVIYDFTPTSPFELAVHGQSDLRESRCCTYVFDPFRAEGATVRVVEEDDGSGWVKVVDEDGDRGLVPASYIEAPDTNPAPNSSAEQSIGSGQFGMCLHKHPVDLGEFTFPEVRGLYDYHSKGQDELDVSEGARIELTSGPSGGRNYADGWWEGKQRTLIVKIFLCDLTFLRH